MEKMFRMITVTPKRYAYLKYKNGKLPDSSHVEIKGLMSARRDNCLWQQGIFNKVIECIMESKTADETRIVVIKEIYRFLTNKVETKDLTYTASMREHYAMEGNMLSIFKEEQSRKGKPVKAGERFDYVVIDINNNKAKKGYMLRTQEDYEEALNSDNPYVLNYFLYIIKNK